MVDLKWSKKSKYTPEQINDMLSKIITGERTRKSIEKQFKT